MQHADNNNNNNNNQPKMSLKLDETNLTVAVQEGHVKYKIPPTPKHLVSVFEWINVRLVLVVKLNLQRPDDFSPRLILLIFQNGS